MAQSYSCSVLDRGLCEMNLASGAVFSWEFCGMELFMLSSGQRAL